MSKRSLGTWLAPMLVLMFALVTIPAVAESHVRIVRLSDVQGAVEVDRGAGQGYEKAFLNMPMVEGMKLATKADGRAEVEFEDGSAVRITPNTRVDFSALSLQDSARARSVSGPMRPSTRMPWLAAPPSTRRWTSRA